MKKVTSIVIGAGLRGGHVYSQYALDHPDEFQVVAVAEPDKERRESFAKRHNIPEELCFESYEELLGKEKLADCAMICTMDRMHYEPTIMALKKGYHVLCEKPMSPITILVTFFILFYSCRKRIFKTVSYSSGNG